MSVQRKLKSKDISNALEATGGMIYRAARRLGVSPVTIYRRLEREPKLKEQLESIRGESIDKAEDALKAAVDRGEAWAVCFMLKCLAKDRGFVERQEITGKDGEHILVKIDR